MIYTHMNVDLDNIVSTLAYCITQKIPVTDEFIQFVPADQTKFPEGDHAILIDMQKNKHTADSHTDQFKEYLPQELIYEINECDATGRDPGNLRLLLNGLRKSGKTDMEIMQWFEPAVHGWFSIQQERIQGWSVYQKIPRVKIGNYTFLKIENMNTPTAIAFYAAKEDIRGTVYASGYNMGITRYPQFTAPDLNLLPQMNGWFRHPRGFLYCFGSRKSIKTHHNAQFNSLDKFVDWLKGQFIEWGL